MGKTKETLFIILAVIACFALFKFVINSDPVRANAVLKEFI